MKTPEILAPVGDWQMLRAAVHNGADAVYIGMPGFNARGRAATLEVSELAAMIGYAHLYGVRVLLACNILIFERELQEVGDLLCEIIPLGPDAIIVQDIGLVALIKSIAPDQVVHASTQMTVTNSLAIELTRDLNIKRYVLGREVSLSEMSQIKNDLLSSPQIELEVFVHGALCVSYSGQCLTSESMGGRSANRGQCAQSCRLPYTLVVDDQDLPLGDQRYLVSPKDLCSIEEVGELLKIGIDSFKIEGRLKSPEYVASTTRAYSDAVKSSLSHSALVSTTLQAASLEKVYSRGFFSGWMHGVNHQELVDGRFGSHHGLEIGTVLRIGRDTVEISSVETILPGDGLLFLDSSTGERVGASAFEAHRNSSNPSESIWEVSFSYDFDLGQITEGTAVFINSSPSLEGRLLKTFSDKSQLKKIPLSLTVIGCAGLPMTVEVRDPQGNSFAVSSPTPLEVSKRAPLTETSLLAELGALSGTVYSISTCAVQLEGSVFLHNRELKQIRREIVQRLNEMRQHRVTPTIERTPEIAIKELRIPNTPSTSTRAAQTQLNVLVREISQIEGIQDLDLGTIYLDFEFGKEYAAAAEMVRSSGKKVGIATTRILKPGELGHLKVIDRIKPDEVLVRNLGALQYFRGSGIALTGDFSLNVSNSLAAQWMTAHGAATLTPSSDLNREQLLEMLGSTPGASWEVIIHHYIPAFHMEHCVFAAFLSSGTSYRDCGRPCEKHRVSIKDPSGLSHPLKADAECRNTMFNGTPQSALRMAKELREVGVQRYRIEALFEEPRALREKVETYLKVFKGGLSSEQAIMQLSAHPSGLTERVGVTDGQLYNINRYSDRKKEFIGLSELSGQVDPGLVAVSESSTLPELP